MSAWSEYLTALKVRLKDLEFEFYHF